MIAMALMAATILAADPPKPPPTPLVKAVSACIEQVRKESTHGLSPFDAYVGQDGQIRWYGYPDDVFKFRKCMDQRGFPVGD